MAVVAGVEDRPRFRQGGRTSVVVGQGNVMVRPVFRSTDARGEIHLTGGSMSDAVAAGYVVSGPIYV